MADGKIIITGDAMQLIRENEKLVKSNEKVEKKYETLKNKSKQSADTAVKASRNVRAEADKTNRRITGGINAGNAAAANYTRTITNIGKGLMSMVGIAGGATAAIAALNSELEKRNRLESEAKEAGQSAESGLQRARANFVADDTVTKENFDSKVQESAAAINVQVEKFATALSDTLSAKGSKSNEFAFQATQAAFQVSPNKDTDSARFIAQSAGDLAKLGESQSPEALIGALLQTQKAARLTNVASTGKTSVQATQAAVQQGASVEEGLELFATLTSLMGDATGELSSTAAIKLVNQLAEFKPLEGIEGPLAKIQALQNDSKLAQQFLEDASFEEKAKGGITSLVTGDARGLAELTEVQSKIGSVSAADDARNAEFFKQEGAFIRGEGTVAGDIRAAEAKAASNIEGSQLANQEGQLKSLIRELYNETSQSVNQGGIDAFNQFGVTRSLDAAQSPEAASRIVQNELTATRNSNFLGGISDREKAVIDQQLLVLKSIDQTIAKLRKEQGQDNKEAQSARVESKQQAERAQRTLRPNPVIGIGRVGF